MGIYTLYQYGNLTRSIKLIHDQGVEVPFVGWLGRQSLVATNTALVPLAMYELQLIKEELVWGGISKNSDPVAILATAPLVLRASILLYIYIRTSTHKLKWCPSPFL